MCIECGTLFHLECDHVSEIINHVESHHKFKVDPGRIVLYGVCNDCSNKN